MEFTEPNPRCAHIVHRHAELGVIEEVEELGAEIQAHLFARQRELFDDGEVGVDEIRADGRDAPRISQLSRRGRDEAGGIDLLQLGVVRAGGVATGGPVGPVPIVAIAAGLRSVPDWLTLSIRGTGNPEEILSMTRELEASEKRVGHVVPIAAELLSAAEGQIVNDAAGEAVVEIDLRQAPIQALPVGKREIMGR